MNSFVPKTPVFGRIARAAVGLGLVAAVSGCTDAQKQGDASSYLTIMSLVASPGAQPETTTTTLRSDVRTFGAPYADPMVATLHLGMKDPLLSPSPTNFVTVQKYRVTYTRADGGDVPQSFEAAATFTVTGDDVSSGPIVLVKAEAKNQLPLSQLIGKGGTVIPMNAQVTFFGVDQAGKSTSVTGNIAVSFSDFDDPGGDPVTPQASFTVAPVAGLRAFQQAIFDATASVVPTGRTAVSFLWEFNDGSPNVSSMSPTTPHVFQVGGTFTVRLTVTDSAGQTWTTERIITVIP